MTTEKVRATISVQSDGFHQTLEESLADVSTVTNRSSSYEELIGANERLKSSLSRIFTEYVNKARVEQAANGDTNKRKIKHDDDDDDEEDQNEEDEEDPESSDDNEEEQQ